jgi:hypothetical protein
MKMFFSLYKILMTQMRMGSQSFTISKRYILVSKFIQHQLVYLRMFGTDFDILLLFSFIIDEWTNFLQRVKCTSEEDLRGKSELDEELRLWASHRGQTLSRTGIKTQNAFGLNLLEACFSWNIGSVMLQVATKVRRARNIFNLFMNLITAYLELHS